MEPLVSICCITFNHGKYVAGALDSFLMQEVDFPYEIIIHDDASTDDTQKIIREYEAKYPELIRAICQTENQYSKGIPIQKIYTELAKGKYLAICEGDDYWTDPHKLQKQINFLEANADCIGTAHNVRVIDENGEVVDDSKHCYGAYPSHTFTLRDAEQYGLAGQTASLVYRNIWPGLSGEIKELYFSCRGNGDQKFAILLTLHGDMFCFNDTMADHRKVVSGGTSWSARSHGKNLMLYRYQTILDMKNFADVVFGVTLNDKPIRLRLSYKALSQFLSRPSKENWRIFRNILFFNNGRNGEFVVFILMKCLTWPVQQIKKLVLHG